MFWVHITGANAKSGPKPLDPAYVLRLMKELHVANEGRVSSDDVKGKDETSID